MLPSHRYICHQDQSSYVHASEECSPQKEYCPKNWYQIQRETEDISHDAVLEVKCVRPLDRASSQPTVLKRDKGLLMTLPSCLVFPPLLVTNRPFSTSVV